MIGRSALDCAALEGCIVLVVEDEAIVAMMLEELLVDWGCRVLGPYNTVRDALPIATAESIDVALLDVNICNEPVFPVAEQLRARGIPLILSTGFGLFKGTLPRHIVGDCTVLNKPYDAQDLRRELVRILSKEPNLETT